MAPSVPKASRREIRRAFGLPAMALLEQHGLDISALGRVLDDHLKMLRFEESERLAIAQAVYDFQQRGFMSRLRWLLRGR